MSNFHIILYPLKHHACLCLCWILSSYTSRILLHKILTMLMMCMSLPLLKRIWLQDQVHIYRVHKEVLVCGRWDVNLCLKSQTTTSIWFISSFFFFFYIQTKVLKNNFLFQPNAVTLNYAGCDWISLACEKKLIFPVHKTSFSFPRIYLSDLTPKFPGGLAANMQTIWFQHLSSPCSVSWCFLFFPTQYNF